MEQIGTRKGRRPGRISSSGEKSRETEGGGREGHTLTEYMETNLDAKLKDIFKSSFKTGNAGFIAWTVLMFVTLVCLTLWMTTGVRWIAFAVAGSSCLACAGILLAFVAQSVNQIVRGIAKLKGKAQDFFKEEEKECSLSKAAAECFGFVGRIFNRGRGHYDSYGVKHIPNRHAGNNARSYRSASHRASAHSSGDGGNDDSGDSDSEPPASHRTAQLKLSQTFNSKSNSFPCLWRLLHVFGCCCMPCRKRSPWRWSA
jgi:hypothetical protein